MAVCARVEEVEGGGVEGKGLTIQPRSSFKSDLESYQCNHRR